MGSQQTRRRILIRSSQSAVYHPVSRVLGGLGVYAARERRERVSQGPLFRLLIEVGARWGGAADHVGGPGRGALPSDAAPGDHEEPPSTSAPIRRLLKPILEAAGIDAKNGRGESVDVHSLRHTCATRLARAGWPTAKLQRFLGHADSRTSQRTYDHLEEALVLVPSISGSKLAVPSGIRPVAAAAERPK